MEELHIGHLIQAELKAQGRTVVWLAKAIHCDRTNVYKIFRSSHIDPPCSCASPKCCLTTS